MTERQVGGVPLSERVWDAARREWQVWYPNAGELRPEHLSAAYRALADFTLLQDAYHALPQGAAPATSDSPWDVATRMGRYMHLLADLFRDRGTRREEPAWPQDWPVCGADFTYRGSSADLTPPHGGPVEPHVCSLPAWHHKWLQVVHDCRCGTSWTSTDPWREIRPTKEIHDGR